MRLKTHGSIGVEAMRGVVILNTQKTVFIAALVLLVLLDVSYGQIEEKPRQALRLTHKAPVVGRTGAYIGGNVGYATGTSDFSATEAADAWAFTYGGAVEWYKGSWTFRGGFFDLSILPNSTDLDPHWAQYQWDGEIEHRYLFRKRPGRIAVTGFRTYANMADFGDAIRLAQSSGTTPDVGAVRHFASRGGLSLNLDQEISPDLGAFARAGFADGNLEPYEFTDIDTTMAAGLSLSGRRWRRPTDTVGVAGLVNNISSVHRAYLAAGGIGLLVGDGQLPHPGPEEILETYYRLPIWGWQATLDYQRVVNPAYNEDRGPASIVGVRLHAQF